MVLVVVHLYESYIFEIFGGAWFCVCFNCVLMFRKMIGVLLFLRCSLFSTRMLKYLSTTGWICFKHECMTLRGCFVDCIGHQ